MLTVLEWIVIGIGSVLLIGWLILFFIGLRYNQLFDGLDEKEYPFKEIYGLGYAVIECLHYKFKSKKDRKLRQELEVLYDKKYVEYYLRVTYAQKITIALTLMTLALPMYGLTNDIMASAVVIMLTIAVYFYFGTLADVKIKKRTEEMEGQFCEAVSQLALLTNSGMILKDAWKEVANAGEGIFYQEMRNTLSEMNNGVPEIDAIRNFGIRCMMSDAKKFASTIVQGLLKGNSELAIMLQTQSKEVWNMRKQSVRRQGEKAAGKLLIPMCMMFIGILIMVLIPIFANLGV